MSEKLEFDLEVKKNNLNQALDNASKKSDSLQDTLTTALGVFAGGIALKGLDALSGALSNSIDFAKESVAAYAEQEDSLNRLRQALRAAGDASESSFEDLANFSGELERLSKQSGEVITQQLAVAKSMNLTNDQAKNLVQAAAELSATFGGSLESNVAMLTKTLNGSSGRLGQMIGDIKELSKESLAAGGAIDYINSRYGGSAAKELESYSGRVFALNNAYDDMKKQLGGIIAESSIVSGTQSALTRMFEAATQAVADFRIELSRNDEGFKETDRSIELLSEKYAELTSEIENQQAIIQANKDDKFSVRAAGAIKMARDELATLNAEYQKTFDIINNYKADERDQQPAEQTPRELPKEILDARAKLNDEILALKQQLIVEENNLDLARDNAAIENETLRNEAELQRLTDFAMTKAELEYQLKEQELMRTQEGEDLRLALLKNAAEKELAQKKIQNDAMIKQANAVRDAEKKAAAERIALQQVTASTITGIIGVSANIASAIAKEGSKEAFFIQKAAALAQAVVATNLAMAMANAVPPPGNIPAIAAAKANGAIAISGILASAIKGFAGGGIVGGESNGAAGGGDDTVITARKDEMMLNAPQQAMLFRAIQSGNLGGGDIVIQIDGMTLFKAMRKVKESGARW